MAYIAIAALSPSVVLIMLCFLHKQAQR